MQLLKCKAGQLLAEIDGGYWIPVRHQDDGRDENHHHTQQEVNP